MNKLNPETIKLITSTQVVTTVATVVKELVENSLDAGAASVDVLLANVGLDRIEVRDDGAGIARKDTPFMCVKHYTSKISSDEDLVRLETFGFRGEALSSLCACADVIITTRTEDDSTAVCYTLSRDGSIRNFKPSAGGRGTTVVATKLYADIPVRRQMYSEEKKKRQSVKEVEQLMTFFGLVHPGVRFSLKNDRSQIYLKNKSVDVQEAIATSLGAAVSSSGLKVIDRKLENDAKISIVISSPDTRHEKTSKKPEVKTFVSVNKRLVIIKEIEKMARKFFAENGLNHSFKTAVCFVALTLSPTDFDVNLTPNKWEVMIENAKTILEAVDEAISSAAQNYETHVKGKGTGSADESIEGDYFARVTKESENLLDKENAGDINVSPGSGYSQSPMTWSKGISLKGLDDTNPEPVSIFTVNKSAVDFSLEKSTRVPPLIRSRDSSMSAAQKTLFESFSSDKDGACLTKDRDHPGYREFSVSVRPRIIKENSGKTFPLINDAVDAEWGRLSDDEKRDFAERAGAKSRPSVGISPNFKRSIDGEFLRKRKSSIPNDSRELMKDFVAKRRRVVFPAVRVVEVDFSWNELAQRATKPSGSNPSVKEDIVVFGSVLVENEKAWICSSSLDPSTMYALNSCRLSERNIFKRRMEDFIVPFESSIPRQIPRSVAHSIAGRIADKPVRVLDVLADLARSSNESEFARGGGVTLNNERLVKNGFKVVVRRRSPKDPVEAQLHSVSTLVDDEDFLHVMGSLTRQLPLPETRSPKVEAFLRRESMMAAVNEPPFVDRRAVVRALAGLSIQDGFLNIKCLHERRVFEPINSLKKIIC